MVVVVVVTAAAAVDLDVSLEDEVDVLVEDCWSAAASGWREKFFS